MEDMIKLESELLDYLGFDKPIEVNYDDLSKEYGTEILEAEHETKMWNEKGSVISLQKWTLYFMVKKPSVLLKEVVMLKK